MLLRDFGACIASLSIFGCLICRVEAQTREEKELNGFYVVTHVVSDASPFNYEYVLDVKPQGRNVLVRFIRIAPLQTQCPGITVKAADHLVTNATPRKVARLNLCSLSVADAASAINGAQPKGAVSIDDTASYSLVAMCGSTERVFELPYPESVDFKKLKRVNPRVASLWDLAYHLQRRSFGQKSPFYDISVDQDANLQALGAEIVPAIKSGLYDHGFANGSHLESLLNKYSGPVKETDPWNVEFLGSAPAELVQYQLPKYPPLARQVREQGIVRLEVEFNAKTGTVTDARIISGYPLLTAASLAAVREWKFQTGSPRKEPVEVSLSFGERCPPQ